MAYSDRSIDPLGLMLWGRKDKNPRKAAQKAIKKAMICRGPKSNNYGLMTLAIVLNLISAFVLIRSFLL